MKKLILTGWMLLLCQHAMGVGTPKLDLVSKEGEKIKLSRAAALKPGVSGLIATSLEADKDAPEVPLRTVSSAILNRFVPIWEFIDTRIGNGLFGELSAAEQKILITAIRKKLGLIKRSEIGELINAANYLDSQPLLQALLWQYSGFLGMHKATIVQQLDKDAIPKGLKTDVARVYFLTHGEDMAPEFAKITIPVDVLAAHGYIPAEMFKGFPSLATNPNEVYITKLRVRGKEHEFKESPLTFLLQNSEQLNPADNAGFKEEKMLKYVKGMLKIKGIDINKFSPLAEAARKGYQLVVAELLHAGADPNSLAADGATSLILAAFHDVITYTDSGVVEMLIKARASIEQSLEVFEKLRPYFFGEYQHGTKVQSILLRYQSQKAK